MNSFLLNDIVINFWSFLLHFQSIDTIRQTFVFNILDIIRWCECLQIIHSIFIGSYHTFKIIQITKLLIYNLKLHDQSIFKCLFSVFNHIILIQLKKSYLFIYITYNYLNMKNSKLLNSSLANSHGISRKDPVKYPSDGIGLNPNFNIEDEYVQNLLKQVHFLNLEIKLVKEKQSENKGLGIMGILNKDQQPVVEHAVQSNLKFQTMKGNLKGGVLSLQTTNLKLQDENLAVKSQKDFMNTMMKKQQQKNYENRISVEQELTENSEKLRQMQKRYYDLKMESQKIKQNYRNLQAEYYNLKRSQQIKKLLKEVNGALKQQEQQNDVNEINEKTAIITANKTRLDKADNQYKSCRKYLELVDEHEALKLKIKNAEKELFEVYYLVKQREELKKLAQRDKLVELELKKQATQEYQRLKVRLDDKKVQIQNKIAEKKIRVEGEQDIKKLQGVNVRKQKQLNQLKKKVQTSQNNYRKLKQDILKMNITLELDKQENKKLLEKEKIVVAEVNAAELQLNKFNILLQKDYNQVAKLTEDSTTYGSKLSELEQQLTYLTAKTDYLEQNVNLNEDMKNVKIEQLRNITYNNTNVNETIGQLLKKWEQMRKFSNKTG